MNHCPGCLWQDRCTVCQFKTFICGEPGFDIPVLEFGTTLEGESLYEFGTTATPVEDWR
jgi:hypothetical protein